MPIASIHKQLIEKIMQNYCNTKIPSELKESIKLSYEIRGNYITLIESRSFWKDSSKWTDMKIAQIRFKNENKTFNLYSIDRNDKWHLYDFIESSSQLNDILAEIDKDPTSIFFLG